jgi:hypothetical protein
LGENVDLSEARALFAAGRSDEAFGVLQSSGLLEKAQSQGLFAVQALQSAMGGMDLTQLAGQKFETGPKKGIASNKQFLSTLKSATETQKIDAANFDVGRAIIRLTRQDLEQGLIYDIGQSANITRLELTKMGVAISKFVDVELQTLVDAVKNPFGTLKGAYNLIGRQGQTFPTNIRESVRANSGITEFIPGVSGVSSTDAVISNLTPGGQKYSFNTVKKLEESAKAQNVSLDSQENLLKSSDTSLKMINAQSTLQTQLLQNIQALTVATSRLGTIGLGDMKLLLDGKEVKSRIEKIKISEKGKTK